MDENQFLSTSFNQINPLTRIILLSDGSLIRHLNALFLSNITIERLRQEEVPLDREMAGYIQAEEGETVIDRDVWLIGKGKRLVYANSILPISLMGYAAYNEITRGETPLGVLFNEHSILTRKDRLRIARIRSEDIAKELGTPEDTEFWCRRYRLHADGGFRGAILEVFSPSLFGEDAL